MEPDIIKKVERLFSRKKYITPWLLSKKLEIDLKDARTLYNEFRRYCLSEGTCIEYKGILYRVGSNVKELLGEEQEKILRKDGLSRMIYAIIKSSSECLPFEELFNRLRKLGVATPSPYILEAIAAMYKRGLIYEKRILCYSAI